MKCWLCLSANSGIFFKILFLIISSLVIRGDKKESAVLCLDDVTYDLKEAETSNTLLLLDNCLSEVDDFQASKAELHHFEVCYLLKVKQINFKIKAKSTFLNINPFLFP